MQNQTKLVQETFARVAPQAGEVAAIFYGRLFEIDPSLRSMFHGDMTEQGRKLMQVLAAAVRGLHDLDALKPTLWALGERHRKYGVEERHYDTVGAALLWTLEQGLGTGFTPEVKTAWANVYGVLASEMKTAAMRAVG